MLNKKLFYYILCGLIGCVIFSLNPGYIQKNGPTLTVFGMLFFVVALLVALPISFQNKRVIFQTHNLSFSVVLIFTIFFMAVFSTLISSFYVQEAAGLDVQTLTLPVGMIGVSALIVCISLFPLLLLKYLSKILKYKQRNKVSSFSICTLMISISVYGVWLLFHVFTLIFINYAEESNEGFFSLNIASVSILFVTSIINIFVFDIILGTYSNLTNKKES